MINDLKLIDNFNVLSENKIVLYGAGYQGIQTLKRLKEVGILPAYFCDGDPLKWGGSIEGIDILSPLELKYLDESADLVILITIEQVSLVDQIVEDIKWLELRTENIFTMFGLKVSLVRNNKTSNLNGGHYNAMLRMRCDAFSASLSTFYLEMFIKWAESVNNVLIYSAPKTGSLTIKKSLSEVNISADHFHELTDLRINESKTTDALLTKYRNDYIEILKSRKSVKIISMVREPVSRSLSLIFHYIGHREFAISDMPQGIPFTDSVLESLTNNKGRAKDLFNWFDNELKKLFGIDVYAHPFDSERGYSIIRHGNIEVLVIKLEKLNSLESVISEFIGVPRFKLVNNNEADNKQYKYLYKQVKEVINIPRGLFDYYYKDPRMAHFYSDDEIEEFLGRWK